MTIPESAGMRTTPVAIVVAIASAADSGGLGLGARIEGAVPPLDDDTEPKNRRVLVRSASGVVGVGGREDPPARRSQPVRLDRPGPGTGTEASAVARRPRVP
jgi:hypothetical protein